jgi:hypothetical protein
VSTGVECRANSCATFTDALDCTMRVMNVWQRAWKSATRSLASTLASCVQQPPDFVTECHLGHVSPPTFLLSKLESNFFSSGISTGSNSTPSAFQAASSSRRHAVAAALPLVQRPISGVGNQFVGDFRRRPMKGQGSGDMEVAYAWTQIDVACGSG